MIVFDNVGGKRKNKVLIIGDNDTGGVIAEIVANMLDGYSNIVAKVDHDDTVKIPWDNADNQNYGYPDFKRIDNSEADYILVLDMKSGSSPYANAIPYNCKNVKETVKRDTTESRKACDIMYKALKAIGCVAGKKVGAREIPFEEVEDFLNLCAGKQVFYVLEMNCVPGYEKEISKAICEGVKNYF